MIERLKLLITGANGQLGQELHALATNQFKVIALTKQELDITDAVACHKAMLEHKPNIVVHCAAYTAVDKAESDKDSAFLVNEQGTINIAQASSAIGAKLVYISTDYVFDGQATMPYEVMHTTNPKTVYGASKLAGEHAVIKYHQQFFIIRTAWVFGRYGVNFVKTMLKLAAENNPLSVVSDQVGGPTYTLDLAETILKFVKTEQYGVYHVTNSEACSWYEFACEIFKQKQLQVNVTPCTTEQFQRPAKRPQYSVLSSKSLLEHGFTTLRPWQQALEHMLLLDEKL